MKSPCTGPAWLFCPAHRPERFAKAWAAGAAAVVLDLEDGTPPAAKADARRHALAWLCSAIAPAPVPALRINPLRSREGFDDLAALLNTAGLPAQGLLLLPKLDEPGELAWLDAQLAHALPGWQLCGLIESARGLRALRALLGTTPRLVALGFGAADFAAEAGVAMDAELVQHARCQFVIDSAGDPVVRLDVPTLALDDEAELQRDAQRARALGFHGKFAIHPRQVAPINRAFAPTDAQRQWARRALQAHAAAGGGAFVLDGQMLDEPLMARARAWLTHDPD